TGRLREPHVVPIHDYGEIDGQLYLEMRLIEGVDLDTLLERDGPLPTPRAVALIHQVAAALDAAHAAGVTHRDVKPQNILVTGDDFAYLVDFGIASATTDEKLTQLGTAVGTLKYMAPERFSSDEVTPAADVYALACVLYESLTGTPPFGADSAGVLVGAHMMQPVPRPSAGGTGVSPAFDAVIAAGMAKDPAERYPSAGALADAARRALSAPERERADTILERADPPGADPPAAAAAPRRRRSLLVAAAAGAVAIAAVAAAFWLTAGGPEHHPTRASAAKTPPPVTAAAPNADQARLLSLLPPGYLAGTCTPATPESGSIWVHAVAMVTCGPNSQPGGPSHATYGLFATPDRLQRAFTDDIANVSLVDCPGEGRSPVSWHYDQTPNDPAGLIACGHYNDHPNVVWTNDEKLMLNDVSGDPATVTDLHTWWDAYG
ncbi:serine/threonine protein kinase, partial [Mycobacterium sp. E2462]|uniref:serine/threonine-protein kinase n=1 Tax=Mycobacterium sp. E2462 TaxID=1834133 RepID=UPI000801E95B